jgi:hypothetical protein
LIAPDLGLFPVQQLRQHRAVGHVGRRRHCRVHQLGPAGDLDECKE